ncbi:MAG: DUF2867 domain-containing protein [Nocardioides sp.]|uniref:DUF2867 domain-containing protein n=1 Tax=Nocardioides sp. TaxID=35761 RepID=UPI00238B8049|nr:DUF2867 domain-containing protein [Nocardioides sp.]MDE0778932.1 DUF2867 domain-containing protein [Nocardioides sp.]
MDRSSTLTTSSRSAVVASSPAAAWDLVASGASGPQWYVDAAPFVVRGALDRLVGGAGRRHRPPGRPRLAAGDRVGFWYVVEADHRNRRLLLEAEVRAPGRVTLDASVAPLDDTTVISLTIAIAPRGILGATYLIADLPARGAVAELAMLHLLTIIRRRDNPWPAASVVEA